MAIERHKMIGGYCLSQRWIAHTLTELKQAMEEYKQTYPPMGYSTRFSEPYMDEESRMWHTIMQRDASCD